MSRACVIVLDAVGAGELPDAAEFGDEGSDTLGNVARAVGGLDLPNMEAFGLGNVEPLDGCPPQPGAPAVAGRLIERSKGKDTTTGHWELMGIVTPQAMPTYAHGFPFEVIDPFMHRTGRGVLGTSRPRVRRSSRSSARSTSGPGSGSFTRRPTQSSRSRRTSTRSRSMSSTEAARSRARSSRASTRSAASSPVRSRASPAATPGRPTATTGRCRRSSPTT